VIGAPVEDWKQCLDHSLGDFKHNRLRGSVAGHEIELDEMSALELLDQRDGQHRNNSEVVGTLLLILDLLDVGVAHSNVALWRRKYKNIGIAQVQRAHGFRRRSHDTSPHVEHLRTFHRGGLHWGQKQRGQRKQSHRTR
jgi:hypothetical protein